MATVVPAGGTVVQQTPNKINEIGSLVQGLGEIVDAYQKKRADEERSQALNEGVIQYLDQDEPDAAGFAIHAMQAGVSPGSITSISDLFADKAERARGGDEASKLGNLLADRLNLPELAGADFSSEETVTKFVDQIQQQLDREQDVALQEDAQAFAAGINDINNASDMQQLLLRLESTEGISNEDRLQTLGLAREKMASDVALQEDSQAFSAAQADLDRIEEFTQAEVDKETALELEEAKQENRVELAEVKSSLQATDTAGLSDKQLSIRASAQQHPDLDVNNQQDLEILTNLYNNQDVIADLVTQEFASSSSSGVAQFLGQDAIYRNAVVVTAEQVYKRKQKAGEEVTAAGAVQQASAEIQTGNILSEEVQDAVIRRTRSNKEGSSRN